MAMNKWIPESDPMVLRRVGKTGEECAELSKVCSRITIQGLDGVDPATGESNPLTQNWATVSREASLPVGAPALEAHELSRYCETLAMVDGTQLKGVSRLRELILGQFSNGSLVKAETFEFTR